MNYSILNIDVDNEVYVIEENERRLAFIFDAESWAQQESIFLAADENQRKEILFNKSTSIDLLW